MLHGRRDIRCPSAPAPRRRNSGGSSRRIDIAPGRFAARGRRHTRCPSTPASREVKLRRVAEANRRQPHGASAYARKNDPPAVAPDAASARLIRRPLRDRLDVWVVCAAGTKQRLRRWERLHAVFRAARIEDEACSSALSALPRGPDIDSPRAPADQHVTRAGGGGTSGARRDAASPLGRGTLIGAARSKLQRRRSVPSRRGFANGLRKTRVPTLIITRRTISTSRDGCVRSAPELQFPGVGRGDGHATCLRRRSMGFVQIRMSQSQAPSVTRTSGTASRKRSPR
jgi:hypothetical protein